MSRYIKENPLDHDIKTIIVHMFVWNSTNRDSSVIVLIS